MSHTTPPPSAADRLRALAGPEGGEALLDALTLELAGRTVVRAHQRLTPCRFTLERHRDISGLSGEGNVADGVLWPDGTASVRWRGEHPSIVFWDRGRTSVEFIHGHVGATTITFLDAPDEPGPAAP